MWSLDRLRNPTLQGGENVIRYEEIECESFSYTEGINIDDEGNINFISGTDFRPKLNPFISEGYKYVKDFYWTPDEMNETDIIFTKKGLERWNEIKKKFEELRKEDKNIFVVCYW